MINHGHKTIPVQVWADVDEGIAETVKYLNTIIGVRTYASCQGTLGEGGSEPYGPQVMVSWSNEAALELLKREFAVEILGEHLAYVRPINELRQ